MRILLSGLIAAAALLPCVFAELACFYPDGKNATGLSPCRTDAEVSHCCRDADLCLSNGMCFSSGLGSLVRRGCTDKTWKSADCPLVCNIDPFKSGDAVLTPCGLYNDYCCGQDESARSCCNGGNTTLKAQVAGGDFVCLNPTLSTPVTSSASSSATSSTGTPTTTASSSNSNSLTTTRNVLAGLTGAFGLAAVVAGVLAAWAFRAKRSQERQTLAANQRAQGLVDEKRVVDGVIHHLPVPFKDEFTAAKRNAGIQT